MVKLVQSMQNGNEWTPIHFDIEPTFNEFVRTFRSGKAVRELLTNPSNLPLNADYLFPEDKIIAELKCLEKNPIELLDWGLRVSRAFRAAGYTGSDFFWIPVSRRIDTG